MEAGKKEMEKEKDEDISEIVATMGKWENLGYNVDAHKPHSYDNDIKPLWRTTESLEWKDQWSLQEKRRG